MASAIKGQPGPVKKLTLTKVLPWLLLIGGVVGVLASVILTNEYINLLKNPQYQPVCNLNPVLSCSSVTTSNQAHAFGFPNEYIGLAGFAATATAGAALLAGAKFKRWFWRLLNVGLLFAVGFITWLQFQTLYRIGSLCIFCMVVWTVTIPMFWYLTLYNFGNGNIKAPKKFHPFIYFLRRHHGDVLILWFLIIIVLILERFWYYWSTLF